MRNVSLALAYSEMHVIAYVYHWDRDTLMKLSRGERRMWKDLIVEQKKAERNGR